MTESLSALKQAMTDYGVKDYTVIEKNGVKIGIFGVMGKESISSAPMAEVTFNSAIDEAQRVVKILKEKEQVDLIVCLSHSGTDEDKSASEDEILAEKVPDIDVIISGHSHTELAQPIVSGHTVIGSCGDSGKNLGVIKLIQTESGWSLYNYELAQINADVPEDMAISQKVAGFKELVQQKYFDKFGLNYDEVVAKSTIQFQTPNQIAHSHAEATIANLISDAYIYTVKQLEGENYEPITAAIIPCGTIRNTIFTGDITAADAFSISSLGIGADGMPGYPLISVYLTGKELKTTCEVDASIQPMMDDAQLYMSGINFTFNPNRMIFDKVTDAVIANEDGTLTEIDDNKLYRIVCGLYSAQMLSIVGDKSFGLMSVVPKNKDGEPITDFEQYIIYTNVGGETRELKEWYALVQYLQSFEPVDGVPQVPAEYAQTEGRKVVDDNSSLTAILSNPNRISITVFVVIPVVVILIVLLMIKLIRVGRRNRNKRKAKLAA
jgi:2',3'-cyclic-nucleotide 2'-phosphodiesterase (5'-nucleotidase family)